MPPVLVYVGLGESKVYQVNFVAVVLANHNIFHFDVIVDKVYRMKFF